MVHAMSNRGRITGRRIADENNAVITVKGGSAYRRTPCRGCPWKVSNTGSFPAEAFRISADTAYDQATSQFGCHESGAGRPATCAGFLLRNADNNLATRIAKAAGKIDPSQVSDGGQELHKDYRAMAIANGVSPDDSVLARCRGNDE